MEEENNSELEKIAKLEERTKKLLKPHNRRIAAYLAAFGAFGVGTLCFSAANFRLREKINDTKVRENLVDEDDYKKLRKRAEGISAQYSAKEAEAEKLRSELAAGKAELEKFNKEIEKGKAAPPPAVKDTLPEGRVVEEPKEKSEESVVEEVAAKQEETPAKVAELAQRIEEVLKETKEHFEKGVVRVVIESAAKDYRKLVQHGKDYLEKGEYEKAIQVWEEIILHSNEEDKAKACHELGKFLSMLGDSKKEEEKIKMYELADLHLEKAVRIRGNASDCYLYGKNLVKLAEEKKGNERLILIKKAAPYLVKSRKEVKDADDLLNKINTELKKSIYWLDSIAKEKEEELSSYRRSTYGFRRGREDERKAKRKEIADANYPLGLIYSILGEITKRGKGTVMLEVAGSHLEKAVNTEDVNPRYYWLGKVFMEIGDRKEANEKEVDAKAENYEKAVKYLEKALSDVREAGDLLKTAKPKLEKALEDAERIKKEKSERLKNAPISVNEKAKSCRNGIANAKERMANYSPKNAHIFIEYSEYHKKVRKALLEFPLSDVNKPVFEKELKDLERFVRKRSNTRDYEEFGETLAALGDQREGEERVRLWEKSIYYLEKGIKKRNSLPPPFSMPDSPTEYLKYFELNRVLLKLAKEQKGRDSGVVRKLENITRKMDKPQRYHALGQELLEISNQNFGRRRIALRKKAVYYLERAISKEESFLPATWEHELKNAKSSLEYAVKHPNKGRPELRGSDSPGKKTFKPLVYISFVRGFGEGRGFDNMKVVEQPWGVEAGFFAPSGNLIGIGGTHVEWDSGIPGEEMHDKLGSSIYLLIAQRIGRGKGGGLFLGGSIGDATRGTSGQYVKGDFCVSAELRYIQKWFAAGMGYNNVTGFAANAGVAFEF